MTTTEDPATLRDRVIKAIASNQAVIPDDDDAAEWERIRSDADAALAAIAPTTPMQIPARKLRKGDVITMGTIKTATIHEDKGYVSLQFESVNAYHGTAFSLDLPVWVRSRTVPPVTLDDVVTALTELAEEWDLIVASHRRIAGEKGEYDTDGHALLSQADERAQCVTAVRAVLARFQPAQPVSFDTYCAWCQHDWTEHVGGKPGVPGGPSTCPTSEASARPECGEYGPNNGVCGQPVIDGVCPDHGEVGPPVDRS